MMVYAFSPYSEFVRCHRHSNMTLRTRALYDAFQQAEPKDKTAATKKDSGGRCIDGVCENR